MNTIVPLTARRSNGTPRGERTAIDAEVPTTDEPRVSPRIISAIQTTTARAATLWDDGYTLEYIAPESFLYFVRRPKSVVDTATGLVTEGYTVDLLAGTCDCQMWERSAAATGVGTCKHLTATHAKVTAALAVLGLGLVAPTPAPAPVVVGWQVVEVDETCGELPGLEFGTRADADAWIAAEERSARMGGERVPTLYARVIWGTV